MNNSYLTFETVHSRLINLGYKQASRWDDGPFYIKRMGKFTSYVEAFYAEDMSGKVDHEFIMKINGRDPEEFLQNLEQLYRKSGEPTSKENE